MKIRRLFLVLLMAVLCFGAMNAHAAEDIASGKSGDLTWRIDANGKLTITGNGDYGLDYYDNYWGCYIPSWLRYYDKIITAEVSVTGITSTSSMFEHCYNLTSIRFTKFDTSNVTSMERMFSWCNNLANLDVSQFDTSNVTSMEGMFYLCRNLANLDVSQFDTSNVTSMEGMFSCCDNLANLDVSQFDTAKVENMALMFRNCTKLKALDVSRFNTCNVENMACMFEGCRGLTALDVSNFNTSNVVDMVRMFGDCPGLTTLDVSNFDTSNVESMDCMFAWCENLTSLEVDNFNTEHVVDMGYMFYRCESLTSLNLKSFNTENVKDLSCIFSGCTKLTAVDVGTWDTKNVEDMREMFYNCRSLTSLDVSNFNTGRAKDLSYMFYWCNNLRFLDISNFDTGNVENVRYMFGGCCKLETLNMDNFTFQKVSDISSMFYSCNNLTTNVTLDISLPLQDYQYAQCFRYAASERGKIKVYYKGECTREVAEKIVNTKAGNSNVHLMDGLNTVIESPVPNELTFNDSGIEFSWTAVEGVEKYRAYYKVNSGSWQKIVDTTGTSCILPANKMEFGNIYTFTVKGISSDGTKATTLYNKAGLSYVYLKPGTEAISARNALGWGLIRLDWPLTEAIEKYNVYYKEQGEELFHPYGCFSENYAYVYGDCTSGKTYVFRITPSGYPSSYGGYKEISIKCLTYIASYDLTLVNGLKGVKITWPKVNGAEGYYIYRKTPEGSYKKISTVKGADNLTYTDGTAQSGSTYYYCVRAYSGSTLGAYEGKAIKYLAPIIASDLTLTNTRNGARIAWNKVTGAEGYYVYRRTPEGSYKKIGTVKGNTSCAYTDRTAANGAIYLYCVRAYSGSTLGNYAGKTTVRMSTTDIAALSRKDSGEITLSWALNNEANGYQVQYSEDSSFASGTFTTVKIESATAKSTTITGLTAGKTYYVRMRSYKTVGKANYYAGWSAIVKAE